MSLDPLRVKGLKEVGTWYDLVRDKDLPDAAFKDICEQIMAVYARNPEPSAEAQAGFKKLATNVQGQGRRADTEEDMPRIKMAKEDVRCYERFSYARRALRKVAEDLTCSGKDDFFKAAGLVLTS
jgi:hypothetical protein